MAIAEIMISKSSKMVPYGGPKYMPLTFTTSCAPTPIVYQFQSINNNLLFHVKFFSPCL
jgi:hypothetical protein